MMRTTKFLLAVITVTGLTACATLGKAAFKEPIVHFQEAKITGIGITALGGNRRPELVKGVREGALFA